MFAAIRSKIQQIKATRDWLQSPVGAQVFHHNQRYFYGNIQNLAELPEEDKQLYINRFYEILSPVLESSDPVHELRIKIVEYACDWGLLQSIRNTEEDLKNNRQPLFDSPYISGELHHHWEGLIQLNGFLRECNNQRPFQFKREFMVVANLQCAVLLYLLYGMNVVRRVLEDETDSDDWFNPFLSSMQIWGEATNRIDMDLPSLLPREFDFLWYALLTHCVEGDYVNPYNVWKTAWECRSEDDSPEEDLELWKEVRAEFVEEDE